MTTVQWVVVVVGGLILLALIVLWFILPDDRDPMDPR